MPMEELLKLAGRISDGSLRERVIDILRNPSQLSNAHFKARPIAFGKAPASSDWHHPGDGGLAEHTLAVTLSAISVAENMRKVYKIGIDMDSLIAGALLHDIGKAWSYRKTGPGWEPADVRLDHTMLGTAELYSRGFPEHVIHIVASHFGENGPTPPMTLEARILHAVDNLDANLDGSGQEAIQLILG